MLKTLLNLLTGNNTKVSIDELESSLSNFNQEISANSPSSELRKFLNVRDEPISSVSNDWAETDSELVWSVNHRVLTTLVAKWLFENNYISPLVRNFQRLTFTDDYGDLDTDAWTRERNKFANKKLIDFRIFSEGKVPDIFFTAERSLGDDSFTLLASFFKRELSTDLENPFHYISEQGLEELFSTTIDSIILVSSIHQNDSVGQTSFDTNDPYEYEQLIAEEMRRLGWDAHATQGSGDQGADVVATDGDVKIIFQAKLYSTPVGNKAVQEVAAAKGFYGASKAVVVSNNGFTKSARQLAESLDVLLLHHDELEHIFSLIDGDETYPPEITADFVPEVTTLIDEFTTDVVGVFESLDWLTSYDYEDENASLSENGYDNIIFTSKIDEDGSEVTGNILITSLQKELIDHNYLLSKKFDDNSDVYDFILICSHDGFQPSAWDFFENTFNNKSVFLLTMEELEQFDIQFP